MNTTPYVNEKLREIIKASISAGFDDCIAYRLSKPDRPDDPPKPVMVSCGCPRCRPGRMSRSSDLHPAGLGKLARPQTRPLRPPCSTRTGG